MQECSGGLFYGKTLSLSELTQWPMQECSGGLFYGKTLSLWINSVTNAGM